MTLKAEDMVTKTLREGGPIQRIRRANTKRRSPCVTTACRIAVVSTILVTVFSGNQLADDRVPESPPPATRSGDRQKLDSRLRPDGPPASPRNRILESSDGSQEVETFQPTLSSGRVVRVTHVEDRQGPESLDENRGSSSRAHEFSNRKGDRVLASIPLDPPSNPDRAKLAPRGTGTGQAIFTVISSLSIVLGAFALLMWITRRSMPNGLQRLPPEVVQSLGRAPLDARQHLQLLRFGNRLLLVCVTPTGSETLTEISDLDEVNRLAALCQVAQTNSISSSFRQVLAQLGKEPAARGFLGEAK